MTLSGIVKRFSDVTAADGLDLTVNDREYLCLLGPTGAGKTTALRVIAGLTVPDEGKVLFDGREVTHLEPEKRNAVLLSQTYSLFPTMTVAENIMFGPDIRKVPEKDKEQMLFSLLDLVRLTSRADSYPRELSGGMQQRCALARAIATSPDVLLLDEPLRALDARLRIDLRRDLKSLARTLGLTVVHVTHDQDEALVMADRIAIIRAGRIVQVGTPAEVFDEPVSPFVANFVGQSNFFTGTVVHSGPEGSVVEDEAGNRVKARPTDVAVGEKAVLAVKVGHTHLLKLDAAALKGKIERMLFEGRVVHVDVDVSGAGRFSAKIPASYRGRYQVGDDVGIGWNRNKAKVFPYPEGGLENELKVD
ncbi:MAG TPA: ABC transporter ATP-binding protein [Methanomassiliicoccaceae archaeon]|nr:ABC transporter ATP-binding protein [Methanomassiliicoccaceae archaeon]